MNLRAVSGSGPDREVATQTSNLVTSWVAGIRLETSEENKCLSNIEEVFTEGTACAKNITLGFNPKEIVLNLSHANLAC